MYWPSTLLRVAATGDILRLQQKNLIPLADNNAAQTALQRPIRQVHALFASALLFQALCLIFASVMPHNAILKWGVIMGSGISVQFAASFLNPFTCVVGSVFCRLACAAACMMVLSAFSLPVHADLIDFDPNSEGTQSANWAPGSLVQVFIPRIFPDDALNAEAQQEIIRGVASWDRVLPDVMVQYTLNAEPPEGARNAVDVNISLQPGSVGGVTHDWKRDGTGTIINGATIDLSLGTFFSSDFDTVANISAHEFGHVLGLDENDTNGNFRDVMDPGLDPESPFITPTPGDKAAADDLYKVAPEPATLALLGLGAWAIACRLRSRKLPTARHMLGNL
jgi:PEP-CTERM motif